MGHVSLLNEGMGFSSQVADRVGGGLMGCKRMAISREEQG